MKSIRQLNQMVITNCGVCASMASLHSSISLSLSLPPYDHLVHTIIPTTAIWSPIHFTCHISLFDWSFHLFFYLNRKKIKRQLPFYNNNCCYSCVARFIFSKHSLLLVVPNRNKRHLYLSHWSVMFWNFFLLHLGPQKTFPNKGGVSNLVYTKCQLH